MKIELSVVIPVLNECEIIGELISRVKLNVESITTNYEIIFVDDGSTDNSWKTIQQNFTNDNRIKGIKLSRNFGHHYAISAGLDRASGDWVVVMDGDLQDRPEVIPELYSKSQEGFDIVFVSRKNRSETFIYRFVQKTFYSILKILSGLEFNGDQANFSILNRKVVEAFRKFPESARFYGSTIKWLGFNRTQIYADQGARHSGNTSYTLKKRFDLALDIILSFSEKPLRISIYFGFVVSTISFVIICYLIFASLNKKFTVVGWPSTLASIFFTTGIVIMVLGIIGLYVGRIFNEVKKRPLYVISEEKF